MAERNLNFDEIIDRRGTDCLKYDFAVKRGKPADVLPLWVADMDFKTSSYVEDALIARSRQGIFGYTESTEDYFEALAGWMKRHHSWEIREEWLIKTPGVVFALAMAVKAFTNPGDRVIIQQPVYYPFSQVIQDNGREIVSSDLILGEDNRYHIDFEDFERTIVENQVKLFLLCNPHNPSGRVFTREELTRLGEICIRHGVLVVADEIHNDFIFAGEHHVFASIKPEFADICTVCTSPSKTFNLASMLISNIFVPNPELRARFQKQVDAAGMSQLSALGLEATKAAYLYGDEWYQAVCAYIKDNIRFIGDYVSGQMPGVRLINGEGTYLVWLDFRGTGIAPEELERRIVYDARLWLDSGTIFGKQGAGFERINAAAPRSVIEECLRRLKGIL